MVKKILMISFIMILSGCSIQHDSVKEKETQLLQLNQKDVERLEFKQTNKMDTVLESSVEIPQYSDECYFQPLMINNSGIIAGKTYYQKGEEARQVYEKSLVILNTSDYVYTEIVQLDDEKNEDLLNVENDLNGGLMAVSDDSVLYYTSAPMKETKKTVVTYYVFDIKESTTIKIHEEKIHNADLVIPGGIISDDAIYYVGATAMNNGIYQYDMKDHKETKIVDGTMSRYLCKVDDELYYVYGEPEKSIVGLDVYSLKTKKIDHLIKENHSKSNMIISKILVEGSDLFIICDLSANDSIIYQMSTKTKEIVPLFKTSYVSSVSMFHGMLTWASGSTIPQRARLQQYIYDYKNKEDYFFDGGFLIGSESGICWQKYLVPEKDIGKGQSFMPENSALLYKPYS
ncbi:MAG: hypothetical protein RR531_10600 [Longicatena sp.]